MASRKEQKEQARAARLAKEQEAATRAQRARRLQIFGGVIALAVVVIVVAIVVSSGGGGSAKDTSTGLATGAKEHQLVNSVDSMLKGIPQSGATLGNPNAKVTMQYFGDLECPICRGFTLYSFPTFVQDYVRTGKVKVQYKSFCTATCNNPTVSDPESLFTKQQVAALAAGQQNKFWQFSEFFYHEQGEEDTGYVTDSYLHGLATQSGVNISQWLKGRNDSSLAQQISSDNTLAQKYGVSGTPTLVMLGPKNAEIVPASGYDGYDVPSPTDLATAVKAVS